MEKFDSIKKQLTELATVLNSFKSEAVQLRILDLVLGEQSEARPSDRKPARTLRGRRPKAPTPANDAAATKQKKVSSGSGAAATLTQLLAGTFFNKPSTINDIIKHCKNNMARTFKPNEFSGSLARLVRTGKLTRTKNANKQYEYKKP